MSDKIKVLVVDDSALVRKIISDILESDPAIEVIGTANNGKTAIFKNQTLNPDVITMDIEMPIMNGLDALQEIMATKPKPVIMMSVLTQHGAEATFKALEYGAVDFIPKPSTVLSMTMDDIADLLVKKVKSVCNIVIKPVHSANIQKSVDILEAAKGVTRIVSDSDIVTPIVTTNKLSSDRLVAIGTSTGGPSALLTIFKSLPKNFPAPILVVQHMPEGFTNAFAQRLNNNSYVEMKEAEDGDIIKPGHGYLAPGHSHMTVETRKGEKVIKIFQSEKVSGHRPSIDVMFDSVNEQYGKKTIAVIMTGMGKDGANGILKIKKSGGDTIAQDEATSVVFGMNRVAVELGAIDSVLPLIDIPKKIVEHL